MDLRLDSFPFSNPGYGRQVAVIGIGSAGCRVASQLSKECKLLEKFVFLTCDHQDVVNVVTSDNIVIDATLSGKQSPFKVRGLAQSRINDIREQLKDVKLAFILAGLGGAVGSGLAPLVAQEARKKGIITVGIIIMPFSFEKAKHFFAGAALKQIKNFCNGVIIIDNEELFYHSMPMIDAFSLVNQKIALALNKLLGSSERNEFTIGLNNVVDFLRTSSYSVLSLAEVETPTNDCRALVMRAAEHIDNIVLDKQEATRSIVHLCADKSVTMKQVISSIGGLSGIIGNGTMQIEYGLSATSSGPTTAILLTTGFSQTKFSDYDPVDRSLMNKGFNLEEDYDSGLFLQMLLPDVEFS